MPTDDEVAGAVAKCIEKLKEAAGIPLVTDTQDPKDPKKDVEKWLTLYSKDPFVKNWDIWDDPKGREKVLQAAHHLGQIASLLTALRGEGPGEKKIDLITMRNAIRVVKAHCRAGLPGGLERRAVCPSVSRTVELPEEPTVEPFGPGETF